MKILISAFFFVTLAAQADGGGTSANALRLATIQLVPYLSVEQKGFDLVATFRVACNESFQSVVRQDVSLSDRVLVGLAGLVYRDKTVQCQGASVVTVNAGNAYSGRASEIQPIR